MDLLAIAIIEGSPSFGSIMKTLFLVRHAKSSRDDPSLPDRQRPLDDRGRRDASKMGKRLADRGVEPDLLVSSPALRALTTAQLIADKIGYKRKDIVVDERIYASSPDKLLAVICALDNGLDRVMLVGHNPEFTDLAHRLSSTIIDMPTCAVVEFHFDAKAWADVAETGSARVRMDAPNR
ncbi:histidine phosphatase family protein [Cupriavidus sp. 2TAF22]|uniref:SixA phosphatase family protein n=1 Tax=unclassified Cupriavidus TaxID=2640874 RepID=UPI003F9241FC